MTNPQKQLYPNPESHFSENVLSLIKITVGSISLQNYHET
jgi:hypothetical protein